jgi:squalene-hopene/tetraprenyl-beta-curcumene cyclase
MRIPLALLLAALPAFCADWNPRLAASYLDSREKAWSEWAQAAVPGGTCFSCHTQMTYLMARPALRRALGETQPTAYEESLRDGLNHRVGSTDPKTLFGKFSKEPLASQSMGVESIFAALFLSKPEAFDRLWSLQIKDGKDKGSWAWFELDLAPWETTDAPFYGASLAALAVGAAPSETRTHPENVAALTGYLNSHYESQPLHNRLLLLWASTKLPAALPKSARKPMIDEAFAKQQPDGAWAIESLGAWSPHPKAPPSAGANSYATAFTTWVMLKAGTPDSDPRMARALNWLRSHQDPKTGEWAASSMNKPYPAGSMEIQFMNDAATGFASMALLEP